METHMWYSVFPVTMVGIMKQSKNIILTKRIKFSDNEQNTMYVEVGGIAGEQLKMMIYKGMLYTNMKSLICYKHIQSHECLH